MIDVWGPEADKIIAFAGRYCFDRVGDAAHALRYAEFLEQRQFDRLKTLQAKRPRDEQRHAERIAHVERQIKKCTANREAAELALGRALIELRKFCDAGGVP